MGQHVRLVLQLFLLARCQTGIFQLLELEAYVVLIGFAAFGRFYQFVEFLLRLFPRAIDDLIILQQVIVVRQEVEHIKLETFLVQQQILMLRVHVYQAFTQLFHLRQGYRTVIDKCPALSRSGKLASEDALIIILQLLFLEEGLYMISRNVEMRLDDALRRSLADRLYVGPLTQQQADSPQNDGLSGSRLAGNDRKTLFKTNVKLLYQRIILNIK